MRILALALPLLLAATGATAKDIRVAVFKVPQLECQNCAAKVVKHIRFERGVKAIEPNVPERTVAITYDADKTTVEKIAKAFGKFDYTAEFLREAPYKKDGAVAGCRESASGDCCAPDSASCCGSGK